MTSLELFSGAGGLALGLQLSGIQHIALIEKNAQACTTLRQNFQQPTIIEGDVREVNLSQFHNIDIIAGGPPCQPFSLGGKAKGMNDQRDMFPPAIAAIGKLMPKVFIFENVKGLLRQAFREYFDYIILQLRYPQIEQCHNNWRDNRQMLQNLQTKGAYSGLRYDVYYKLLNAADFGVAQKRERVIIVGFRHDLQVNWQFPEPTHSADALLWQQYITGEYWTRHKIAHPRKIDNARAIINRLTNKYGIFSPTSKPWQTIRDALVGLNSDNGLNDHQYRTGAKVYKGHTGSPIDAPSKTLKAGDHGVPGGENMICQDDGNVRYFTILEAKRIQTFPDNYAITGPWSEAMRQLGNAVPVRLAQVIGNAVLQTLNQAKPLTYSNRNTYIPKQHLNLDTHINK